MPAASCPTLRGRCLRTCRSPTAATQSTFSAAWWLPASTTRTCLRPHPSTTRRRGIACRHDWGSQYTSWHFQGVLKWLGIADSPAFVGEPLSRLQTGTTVLATAPPAGKAGVLGMLRARVTAVGDWAVGRRGPERAVIATLALAYVLPFALALVEIGRAHV